MQHEQEIPTKRTGPKTAVVIRSNQRKVQVIPGNPVRYEWLSPEGLSSLAMFRVIADPGQSTGYKELQHGGDESLLLLSGTCEVEIEGAKQTLKAGDSMFIPRGQRHRLTNVGTEPSEAIFVLSPPEY